MCCMIPGMCWQTCKKNYSHSHAGFRDMTRHLPDEKKNKKTHSADNKPDSNLHRTHIPDFSPTLLRKSDRVCSSLHGTRQECFLSRAPRSLVWKKCSSLWREIPSLSAWAYGGISQSAPSCHGLCEYAVVFVFFAGVLPQKGFFRHMSDT